MDNDITSQASFNAIIVSKKEYFTLLTNSEISICFGLINCIVHQTSKDYKMYLMVIANRLYELHRLVYLEKDVVKKPNYQEYQKHLFDNNCEDLNEFKVRYTSLKSKRKNIEHDYQSFLLLKQAISKMISNSSETIYTSEYAGLIDFVLNRKQDLPNPEFEDSIYVTNWIGYHPTENEIAKEFIKKYGLY